MTPDHTAQTLRALPVQCIETSEGVILKRGRVEITISGGRAAEVVQMVLTMAMTQDVTPQEICELFAAPDRPAVQSLIEQLVARRLLVPSDAVSLTGTGEDSESSLDVFYWHFGASAARVSAQLNRQRIVILGVNCISRQLAATLSAAGLENLQVVDAPLLRNLRLFDHAGQFIPTQWPAFPQPPLTYEAWAEACDLNTLDCLVATSDFGGQHAMRVWNAFCVEHQCCFLPVVLQDLIGYVGPLVIPGETACFECLRARQNAHMRDPERQRATEGVAFEGQVVTGFHPAMASVLGDLAAIELTKFYSGALPLAKVGTLIEVNLLASRLTARKVLKLPRCTTCSPLHTRSSTTPKKIVFTPASRTSV